MRILFNIGHPGHVHLFKNLVWELNAHGHECLITVINKDVSLQLLRGYGIDFEVVGNARTSIIGKSLEMSLVEARLLKAALSFKPDLLVGGVGNVYVAHIGKLLQRPSIVFDDTEHSKIEHLLMDPFVNAICTPSCYNADIGPKQVRYNGYHELAYLHPNRFTPDLSTVTDLGLTSDDVIIVVRFVSWRASHDVGHYGIQDKVGLVKRLERYGRVIITSEGALPKELQAYRLRVLPEKLHDLLNQATLYVGEGATTASECAMLGTHAIYVNTLKAGTITEQEDRYHLVSDFSRRTCTDESVIEEAVCLLDNNNLKREGKEKRGRILAEKLDVTAFMVWFIENYPSSAIEIKQDPMIQNRFIS
jgi:uncharacterized protein